MKRSTIIILAVLAILVFWIISVRNGLASAEVGVNGKWGDVETQYDRKQKLYENVVNTIKGAAKNEDTTLIKIVQMRSRIPNVTPDPSNPDQLAQANKQYSDLGKAILNVNVEAYPTLQATRLYEGLQAQIEGTENRIAVAIRDWNGAVGDYNNKLVRFPANIVAGIFGYKPKAFFKAEAGAKDTKVDFGS
jgi:LemA protein